jgi:hypothetical protein
LEVEQDAQGMWTLAADAIVIVSTLCLGATFIATMAQPSPKASKPGEASDSTPSKALPKNYGSKLPLPGRIAGDSLLIPLGVF